MENITRPLKIGAVQLKSNVLLAPMAGYGDIAFRRLCQDFGVGLTTTEMISAKGLMYGNVKTHELMRIAPNENPSSVQLFGGQAEVFERVIKDGKLEKFDIIDINMGCPVLKIVRCGEGSALMKDRDNASAIVSACVKATDKPITVKMRLGFDTADPVPFIKAMADVGASMVAVHGRTRTQMYNGEADWDMIATAASSVKIPVVGNGDINSFTSAKHRLNNYGLSGIMIGRGALGHPDIFATLRGDMGGKIVDVILQHIEYMRQYFPDKVVASNMRKHMVYYLKGVPCVKDFRARVNKIVDIQELIMAIKDNFYVVDSAN